MLGIYEQLLKQVDNRARFISGVLSGDINCINRKKNELRQELMEKGFDPLPKEKNAEHPDVDATDYDYLTKMSVASFHEEYLQHLLELKRRFEIKVGLLRKAAPQCLNNSEKELSLLHANFRKAQSDRYAMLDMAAKNSRVFVPAPRRQHKRIAAESLESSAVLMDDDEEEASECKDQSQEHTETECSQKQECEKQRRRRKKRRKESSETGVPRLCCRALDFMGHGRSGDGFLVEEIKRISSGLDGIEITH